jgi:hypothetical protein
VADNPEGAERVVVVVVLSEVEVNSSFSSLQEIIMKTDTGIIANERKKNLRLENSGKNLGV